jgi:release factor glutamine methyltransferase
VSAPLAVLARQAADRLRPRLGADQDPVLDAEILARHVLGWSRETWISRSRETPPQDFAERLASLVARRAKREPIAYIIGTKEFWGLDFEVTPAVLIPRPCTETLVEQALGVIDAAPPRSSPYRVADVGTGSGSVAISLAVSRPAIEVTATDISSGALEIARRNAARHGVADRVRFVHGSLLEGVPEVDLVVSNPPYIGLRNKLQIMPDVWAYEPLPALFGGEDGLETTRELLAQVAARRPVPPLMFEFGTSEAAIRTAVEAAGLRLVRAPRDLAGLAGVACVEA